MAVDSVSGKPCVKCGSIERYANGNCRPCQIGSSKAWQARHHARNAANVTAYRKANKAKCNALIRAWQKANPEALRRYRAVNKDKKYAATRAWAKANPEVLRIHCINRRAKKLSNGGKISKGLAAKLFWLQRGMCACCHVDLIKAGVHMDHVMPLSAGGSNDDGNIQLLCPTCNCSKHDKHPVDFMQSRGFLL